MVKHYISVYADYFTWNLPESLRTMCIKRCKSSAKPLAKKLAKQVYDGVFLYHKRK
jgi:hypothetical protein